jgi:hypothetical protein
LDREGEPKKAQQELEPKGLKQEEPELGREEPRRKKPEGPRLE